MNVMVAYIPKSKVAREVAKVVGLTEKEVRGQYVANLPITVTRKVAAKLAYVLAPEMAMADEQYAFEREDAMRREMGDKYADALIEGGWALGMTC